MELLPITEWASEVVWTVAGMAGVWALAKLRTIASQFKPNGGSSMRDAIDAINRELLFNRTARTFLFDITQYCGFETDAYGANTMVTQAYIDYVGRPPEQLQGMNWLNMVPLEYEGVMWRARVRAEITAALEDKRRYRIRHPLYVLRDGIEHVEWVDVMADPVVAEQNKLLGAVGVFSPVKG